MNMKRKVSLVAMMASVAIAIAAIGDGDGGAVIRQKVKNVMDKATVEVQKTVTVSADMQRTQRMRRAAANGLEAAFSVQGVGAQETVWAENFDNGSEGWTLQNGDGGYVTWKLAAMSKPAASDDVQSLTLDVPYQTWKREKAYAKSPEVAVPQNGMLHVSVYCSKTYNDYATLTISISDDDFATQTDLWKSTAITESVAKWNDVEIDLAAFAGKTVKIMFTYGAGTNDNFDTGGYMFEFGIDNIAVTGVAEVTHIDVMAGEEIQFIDMSKGTPTSWTWSFPGGTPAVSNEQNPTVYYTKSGTYDVTLTVGDADGEDVKTLAGYVTVTGTKPHASFDCPASFRDATTHLKMVAPLVPVQYMDTSTGFPTSWTWLLTNGPTSATDEYKSEQNPWIAYNSLDKQYAILVADNDEQAGEDDYADLMSKAATDSVIPKYYGLINNLLSTDYPTTYDMADDGKFPGSCKIAGSNLQGFAEKFSKPSRPILVYGAYVYASEASADELYDQIMPVTFSLTRSNNGVPGEVIDFDSWTIPEMGYAIQNNNGLITVEFSTPHIIDEEFFITVTGLPEKNESLNLTFAMAPMRSEGNTAYMLKNDEWRPMTGYYQTAPGGQTSFYIYPDIAHSVITPLPVDLECVEVPREGGIVDQDFFSLLGYEFLGSDAAWCTVVSTPNGMTLDVLKIKSDPLPDGMDSREALLTFTDGVTTITLKVVQNSTTTSINAQPSTASPLLHSRWCGSARRQPASRHLSRQEDHDGWHGTHV